MLIHYRMPLPIFIYLYTCIPYLNTCIAYLNTLTRFRLSAPYLNTLNRLDSSRQPRAPENPRLSAANQNRVLRHPNRQPIRIEHGRKPHQIRQPIRIEYYVTRVVNQSESIITSPESSLRHPRARVGSL